MNLIAIKENVDVYSQDGIIRVVPFGEFVGVLLENKNDGTLLLKSNELVNIDSVAISVDSEALKPVSFTENKPVKNTIKTINTSDKKKKIRRILVVALLATGTYFMFNGRKSVGIAALVFGVILLKNNTKK